MLGQGEGESGRAGEGAPLGARTGDETPEVADLDMWLRESFQEVFQEGASGGENTSK